MAGSDKLTLGEMEQLSVDDRMAVMNMVKDGELSVPEAIARVKGDADTKRRNTGFGTISRKMGKLFGRGDKDSPAKGKKGDTATGEGFQRRGAVKRNRGRIELELR